MRDLLFDRTIAVRGNILQVCLEAEQGGCQLGDRLERQNGFDRKDMMRMNVEANPG